MKLRLTKDEGQPPIPRVYWVVNADGERDSARWDGEVWRHDDTAPDHLAGAEYWTEVTAWIDEADSRVLEADYVGEVRLESDPMTRDGVGVGDSVELSLWRNPESGKMVAIDNLEIDANANSILAPYDEGVRLVFRNTFTGPPV